MKGSTTAALVLVVAGVASGAGYWLGSGQWPSSGAAPERASAKSEREVLFYRNPMVPTDTSPVPKKAPDGMDYVPVYADEVADEQADKGKILYYRNPMGLPDTSPEPKKDPMGMDYVPVYAGDEPASDGPVVKISPDKVQKLGVRTEAATSRELVRTVRAVASIQANERHLHTVAPKFEGWIQNLYVNSTGQAVKQGEALMEVYSPELITAQREYINAWNAMQLDKKGRPDAQPNMRQLADGALQRLRNWDIADPELQRLQQERKARQYLALRSPVNGVVLEKPAIQGMRFMPGEVLYQIADLSTVWLLADVFEQDLGMVHVGQPAAVRIDAYPGREFTGNLTFIYPTVTAETRTAKVRVELVNPQGLLKPSMYARVEFASSHSKDKALTVPDSAVLDTGARQVVLVQRGEGRFEPRPVKLGMRTDGYIEVLEGIEAGEEVVVSANFLIDAESNLKAALGSFGHAHGAASSQEQSEPAAGGEPAGPSGKTATTHTAEGTVEDVDAQAGTVTLAHDPVASLKWPAMTMDFQVGDKAQLAALKPEQRIWFEFVEAAPGKYRVVRVQPPDSASAADAHKGH